MKTDKQLKVFEGSGSGKLTGKRWLLAETLDMRHIFSGT